MWPPGRRMHPPCCCRRRRRRSTTPPALPPPLRALQVACLAAYITALFLWAWAEMLNWRLKRSKCVAGSWGQ